MSEQKMTYHEYQEQTEIYNARIAKRIYDWARIAQTELTLRDKTDTRHNLANTDASRFMTEDITERSINYSYSITMDFDIFYSGCSNEEGELYLPTEILCEDEKEWDTFLDNLEKNILTKNNEVLAKIEENKALEKAKKDNKNKKRELAEYERLKKKFEKENND